MRNTDPPSGLARAAGYLVPMLLCGLLGAGGLGYYYVSGGGLRRERDRTTGRRVTAVDRASEATPAGAKRWAAVGLVIGLVCGALIGRASERGSMP